MVVIAAVSSGATACISQSLGAGRMIRAQLYIFSTIVGSLLLGVLIAIPGWIFEDRIPHLVQMPEDLMPISRDIWKNRRPHTLPVQYVNSATGVMFRATRMVMPPLLSRQLSARDQPVSQPGAWPGFPVFPITVTRGLMWANMFSQIIGSILNLVLLKRSGYLQFNVLPTPA